jgi:hypothetical protein
VAGHSRTVVKLDELRARGRPPKRDTRSSVVGNEGMHSSNYARFRSVNLTHRLSASGAETRLAVQNGGGRFR